MVMPPRNQSMEVVCPICNTPFTATRLTHGAQWAHMIYCGAQCRKDANRMRASAHQQNAPKPEVVVMQEPCHRREPMEQGKYSTPGSVVLEVDSDWDNWCELMIAIVGGKGLSEWDRRRSKPEEEVSL